MSSIARLSRLTAPAYSLTVDGVPGSSVLTDRLLSLSVTLNNGRTSDQLSLSLDDRPTAFGEGISLPRQGATVDVAMGYQSYQAQMGSFQVNQISRSGSSGGRGLTVDATPELLLSEKTRTWGNCSIADIVAAIADENQLTSAVSQSFSSTTVDVINQLNQPDSAFLSHLAERYNAVCKPMAGKLLFMEKGQGTSASGLPMLPVAIKPHDVLQWSWRLAEREDFTKVVAYWPDLLNGRERLVCFPGGAVAAGDTVRRLPHSYNTEAEALAAAAAKFDEINRGDNSLNLTIIGNPDITAEGKITLEDLHSDVDGDYIVKSATHSFSSGGYQTTIQAYVEPS